MSTRDSQNKIHAMLESMTFTSKLLMILALPVLAFLYFSYHEVRGEIYILDEDIKIAKATELNVSVSNLIHELQKERGASAVYLGSKGKKFVGELGSIRTITDKHRKLLEENISKIEPGYFGENTDKLMKEVVTDTLPKLGSLRSGVSNLSVSKKYSGKVYTDIITVLMDIIAESVKLPEATEMSSRIQSYLAIQEYKERAGRHRAAVAGIFGSNVVDEDGRARVFLLKTSQETFYNYFIRTAPQKAIDEFKRVVKGKVVDEVKRMEGLIINNGDGFIPNVKGSYWFSTSTARIDLINEVVIFMAEELISYTENAVTDVKNGLYVTISTVVIILLGMAGFITFIARQVIVQERKGATADACLVGTTTNILIADENDNLIYLNDASSKSLEELTPEIKKVFPNFDVDKLVGSSIHQFHKDPANIKRILAGLKEGQSHSSKINIGELTLSLTAAPVYQRGKKIGHFAEWADITAIEAANAEKARIEKAVNETALSINEATRDIATGNTNLSERTEAQAASIEQTTATMQQLTERVAENAENAQSTLEVASTTKGAADRGGAVVKTAMDAMAEISESSNKINDIIGVIDEIAFQTNLLALNAAVEAARAGEQGRGFAVVASEVRTLAGRSATAAKEIKDLISESVEKVKVGTHQVNETGECLTEIITNVEKVTDMVNGIVSSSQEQAESISEINKTVAQMDSFTQQNAALVEEAASASKSLEEQASGLVETMNS